VLLAARAQRPHRADGDQVLRAEQRGRRLRAGQQLGDRGLGGGLGVQVVSHQARFLRHAGLPERILISGVALLRGRDRGQVAQEGDPAVPVADEVRDTSRRALAVVGHHAVRRQQGRRPVHEHQRGAVLLIVEQVALVATGRNDDQPVHPAGEQGRGEFPFALRALVEAARQNAHAAHPRDVLHRPVDAGGVRVGDVFQHQADGQRPAVAAAQIAGGQVVPVVQLEGRPPHSRGQGRVDRRFAVDDAGHRLEADAGQPAHVAHGGPAVLPAH
jgi:hypothetical protein